MVILLQPLSLSVVLHIDAVVLCSLQVCICAVVSMLGDSHNFLVLMVILVVFLCVLFVVSALWVLSFWYLQPILLFHMFSLRSLCMMRVPCQAFVVISALVVVILLQPLSFFVSVMLL